MSRQILILHAPDAAQQAQELALELENRSFEVVTYDEMVKTGFHRTPLAMYLPDFADKFAAIIVISSHELFKDNSLMDVAERAAIFKKFIPVLFDCVAPPTSWFSMYSNIDLNRTGGSRDREFERLVVSLMNKVL